MQSQDSQWAQHPGWEHVTVLRSPRLQTPLTQHVQGTRHLDGQRTSMSKQATVQHHTPAPNHQPQCLPKDREVRPLLYKLLPWDEVQTGPEEEVPSITLVGMDSGSATVQPYAQLTKTNSNALCLGANDRDSAHRTHICLEGQRVFTLLRDHRVQKYSHAHWGLGRERWLRQMSSDALEQCEGNRQHRPTVRSPGCRAQINTERTRQDPLVILLKTRAQEQTDMLQSNGPWSQLSSSEVTGTRRQWHPKWRCRDKTPVRPEFCFQQKHHSEAKAEMKTFSNRD